MVAKRKHNIMGGYDPNKSDSEDENFDPSEDKPRRPAKRSRRAKPKGSASGSQNRRRANKYAGSDIEDDDEDMSDSDREVSFDEHDDEEEEDDDAPLGAGGRRKRKAAVKHQSYKESSPGSGEEDVVEDSNNEDDDLERLPSKPPPKPAGKPSRIVLLKLHPDKLAAHKGGQTNTENLPPPSYASTRRATRARTAEQEEFLELSNSGRHAVLSRDSRSKSPETAAHSRKASRAGKGFKKPPAPIEEATQETEPKTEDGLLADEELPRHSQPQDEMPVETDVQSDIEGDVVGDVTGDVEADGEADADVGTERDDDDQGHASTDELAKDPEAEDQAADGDEDEDDDAPITRRRNTRGARASMSATAPVDEADDEVDSNAPTTRGGRTLRKRSKKSLQEPSSDFEPGDEGSASEGSQKGTSKARKTVADESSSPTPRGRRAAASQAKGRIGTRRSQRNQDSGDEEPELDKEEMAEELEELRQSSRSRPGLRRRRRSPSIQYEERQPKRRRVTKPVDYTLKAIDPATFDMEEEEEPAATPARRKGGRNGATGGWERGFNTTYGPFGGGGGAGSLLGGPWGTGATGGVESDSSDDEMGHRASVGGAVGMTPTSAAPPLGLFGGGQAANADGGAPSVGKVKDRKALADADPLGVDLNVDFSQVGGLQGHIDQLKEMVQLPLLYPELFAKFHVTPPRGVLFHGPPGTGKTLLARALANSVGIGGRKITFYMRKGADALSKWVGEAEKQLRLLFEEARRTQPSIIFFDEIDGLAPVRSSKQEQIHASIVSTLLALMDGMDGRGQVIVIGATNRPDNIDPALRRPGRFDREFYFPLPDKEGRRSIVDIHTKDWGISDQFKDTLAERTKGYGGADLRALCTEAAINAIQRTYPQIYSSKEKLIVDPDKISIHATDFMISIKKLIPSSERSTSAAATPLPKSVEPLLRSHYLSVINALDDIFPRKKKVTALEEAMYEHPEESDYGFGREALQQEFERSRVFRPRLLLTGKPGMGQNYLSAAILHKLEGVHVQNFDLGTLMGDGRVSF
jgi:SpoVK/Ycf46/Vps4 family AAA+-type ATPase